MVCVMMFVVCNIAVAVIALDSLVLTMARQKLIEAYRDPNAVLSRHKHNELHSALTPIFTNKHSKWHQVSFFYLYLRLPGAKINAANQFELQPPPGDVISDLRFAPESNKLLVASWDKCLYVYEIENGQGRLADKFEHRAAVLNTCFGENDNVAFTAGLDWQVKKYAPLLTTTFIL